MNSGNHKVVPKRYCTGYSLNWDMSPGKIRIIFFQVLILTHFSERFVYMCVSV